MSTRPSQQPDSPDRPLFGENVRSSRESGSPSARPRGDSGPAGPDEAGQGGVLLTGQRLFCTLCLLLVLMPLVYMGGVLAGRHQVERELAARSPMAALQKAPEASGEAGEEEDAQAGGSQPGDVILKPQELTFSRVLRAAPGEKVPELGQIRPFKPVVAAPAKPADDAAPAMAPGMSPAVESGGPPEPPAQEADLFDFVFQIAAFHSAAKAEEMRMRIEAEGFRSRMEKSGRLYIVLLLTRGPKQRVQEVREVLLHMRLGEPIERSRRAVYRPVGER